MVSDARGFFDDKDGRGLDGRFAGLPTSLVMGPHLLHQVVRRGQGRWASAYVEDIDLHALAFGLGHRYFSFLEAGLAGILIGVNVGEGVSWNN